MSAIMAEPEHVDEQMPLLAQPSHMSNTKKTPTPLPKLQLTIALLLQMCEPITSSSLYPYINQVSPPTPFCFIRSG
jgi:hypothetical protein